MNKKSKNKQTVDNNPIQQSELKTVAGGYELIDLNRQIIESKRELIELVPESIRQPRG